jgi:hypothetical protein
MPPVLICELLEESCCIPCVSKLRFALLLRWLSPPVLFGGLPIEQLSLGESIPNTIQKGENKPPSQQQRQNKPEVEI